MPARGTKDKKDQAPDSGKLNVSFKKKQEPKSQPQASSTALPIFIYGLKDMIKGFVSQKNFPDALAIAFAIISAAIAFPFFPLPILVPIVIAIFIITLLLPLGGLIAMLFTTLLMFIYQAPLLAWILTIFISVSLFLGYKHYRSITFVYVLIMLPLSSLGYLLEMPVFVIGTLFIGFRRAIVSTVVVIAIIAILSGMTGLQNSSPVFYNASAFHNSAPSNITKYLTPSKSLPSIGQFPSAVGSAFSGFFSFTVAQNIFAGFDTAIGALSSGFEFTLIQIFAWLLTVFAITNYVVKSRSPLKGTEASLFALVILATYAALTLFNRGYPNLITMISFVITPGAIFVMESNNVQVVKTLEVMKQDFLGKFGEAFQDLSAGDSRETLDDVADYTETKRELREAILAPIEHREIAGAYNVKPAKGILLFGPPGTGKTMMMRALSNEIRAKFFYVKTSSIVSPFQGESAQTLSKIFATVKKNTPAVLFFDEIDGIAAKRDQQDSDIGRQIMTTLLSEMDGFQKLEGIVIVGSTNAPQLLDESILRPGRFDKIIYMPLPDKGGRAKIFEHYLAKLPCADTIDTAKLADITNRYSGADIKNVCDEVARQVADEAVKQHKVLNISLSDISAVIKATKPSTSLASLDKYNQFEMDYERRSHPELMDNKGDQITVDDVIGLDDVKKTLYEAVEIPILHPSLVKKYDVQNIRGILMFGPPGTGKTMLMRAVASELEDVTLIVVSGSELAKNGLENELKEIKGTFNRARENAPCIIFIDEIDAILPSRSDSSEMAVQVTSEFLQQLDGMKGATGVVLVGATNRPDKLDPAIIRPGRIDRFIFVPPPNRSDRMEIFRKNLEKAPLAENIDYETLAEETDGFTGADIANVCRQVKLNALEENVSTETEKLIGTKDILAIVRNSKPSAPSSSLGKFMNFISLYGGTS